MRVDGSIVLNPGLLRDQITWQQKAVTGQDSFGQDVFGWVDFVTCRAQVLALDADDEIYRGSQFYGLAKYKIVQHYSRGLGMAMRVAWLFDGQELLLNVLSINPAPGMRQYQTILAKDYEA